jgi:hypothetical protein
MNTLSNTVEKKVYRMFYPNQEWMNGVHYTDESNAYIERIINRTPHSVTLYRKVKGELRVHAEWGKDENPLRVSSTTQKVGTLGGCAITRTVFGKAVLPDYKADTWYIVSALVKQAHPERKDLLTVNEAVRDEEGRIIGCMSLAC